MQFRPTFGPRGGPIGCGTGRAGPVLQCGRLLDRDKCGRNERRRDGRPAAPAIAMRVSRFTVWLLVTGFCLLGAMVPPATAAPKSVLVLSEGPVLPYGLLLIDNIVVALRRDSSEPLNIYRESIDRIRFNSDEYERQLVALYNSKYVGAAAPALIITITEPALDFALRHREELFPNAAILFGAVDERAIRGRAIDGNVTGVFHHYDVRSTIEAALIVHPRTRRILVVGGASRLDHGYAGNSA